MPAETATPSRKPPRALANATVLQIVPALRDDPAGHAAVDIALALLKAGARAIIAGDGGPLVGALRTYGGEWLPLKNDTLNPFRLRANAKFLRHYTTTERVDIVHAQSPGAAWSGLAAVNHMPVWLVTSFPDRLAPHSLVDKLYGSALARGDRVLAPSSFISRAVIERYGIPAERITVVPRSIDTAMFSATAASPQNIAATRNAWGILPNTRVVLAPGAITAANGQMNLVDAARLLTGGGNRGVTFVLAGDDRADARYVRALRDHARAYSLDTLFRVVGPVRDMSAALAAADIVAITAVEPPLVGHAVSEAQAMGRPVVTTAVGVLPEHVLFPPRMPDGLRTGWVVRPGHAGELATAIAAALALDPTAYAALGARAKQFAQFMFSPPSVAEAIRGVYTALLARDR